MDKPVKQQYDFNSSNYSEMYFQHHQGMITRLGRIYEKKLKVSGFIKGKILDAGCGFGGLSLHLAGAFPGIECIGVDYSQNQVDLASGLAAKSTGGERITLLKADVQQLPFDDHSFDAVFNLNVTHIIQEPIRMFNEFERVLKPEGFLFVRDLKKSWLSIFEDEIKYSFTAKKAQHLISQSNLRKGLFSSTLLWWNYEIY